MIDYGRKPNSNVTTYVNIDTYRSEGISLNNTLKLRRLEMRAGFAYTGRYNKLTESDTGLPEFTWSPEVNGSLTYSPRQDVTLSMFYKYTGSTPTYVVAQTDGSIVLAKSSGFHWGDVTLRKRLGEKLSFTVGSHNVLNTTRVSNSSPDTGSAHSGSGTTIPVGYGRSYFIALNFQITQ
jgi:outer membrane receptor for ferrienterochelin and colicins